MSHMYTPGYVSNQFLTRMARQYSRGVNGETVRGRYATPIVWKKILLFRMKHDPSIERLTHFGSRVRGTGIDQYSDLDILTVLPGNRPSDPAESVGAVMESVVRALDGALEVHLDYPAVQIFDPFTGLSIDFVPAYHTGSGTYHIFDSVSESWVATSPARHNDYVIGGRSFNNNHLTIVRLVKIWNFFSEASLSSIYLEIFASQALRSQSANEILNGLLGVFNELRKNGFKTITDPSADDGRTLSPKGIRFDIDHAMDFLDHSIESAFNADAQEKSRSREGCIDELRWVFAAPKSSASDSVSTSDQVRLKTYVESFSRDPRYREVIPARRRRKMFYTSQRRRPFYLN